MEIYNVVHKGSRQELIGLKPFKNLEDAKKYVEERIEKENLHCSSTNDNSMYSLGNEYEDAYETDATWWDWLINTKDAKGDVMYSYFVIYKQTLN